MMNYLCGKFGDCSFRSFGFIMRADRHMNAQTDANKRFTRATIVGVSNYLVCSCTWLIAVDQEQKRLREKVAG